VRIVRFCEDSIGVARACKNYLTNKSLKFQKGIDGFFSLDIMRPLLLLQQEVRGSKRAVKIKPEI
jgi:hypothetical protein